MKLMKSGIEVDAAKQEKLKGGYCVCYCDMKYTQSITNYGTEDDRCNCRCRLDPAAGELDDYGRRY